jgi:hypothetical protein
LSNVFKFTVATYFQIPEAVIETGVWAKLTPSAQSLYVLLAFKAQRLTSTTIKITAADAAKVGVSANCLKGARENLVATGLVTATRSRDGYTYEILDPVSGERLEQIRDLRAVDPDIVGEYFARHLADFDVQESSYQHLQSQCPFCDHKERLRPFHVSLSDGGGFKCHSCEVDGGLIDFEKLLAGKDGKALDTDQAYARARSGLLAAGRRLTKHRTEQIAEARAAL